MKKHKIDYLFIAETQMNANCKEAHDGYTFYFSTGVTEEQKMEANKTRELQKKLNQDTQKQLKPLTNFSQLSSVVVIGLFASSPFFSPAVSRLNLETDHSAR